MHFAAGFLLGLAALVRLFPAAFLLGPAITALQQMWRERRVRLDRGKGQLFLGALAAGALLVPATLIVDGPGVWGEFTRNIEVHIARPTSNRIGLRSIASHSNESRLAQLRLSGKSDLYGQWMAVRERTFEPRRYLFYLMVAGFLGILWGAVRGREDWTAAILSGCAIPILFEASCYYYAYLLSIAFLLRHSRLLVAGLLLYAAANWLLVPLVGEADVRFVWLSALTVCLALGVVLRFWLVDDAPASSAQGQAQL